MSRKIFSEIFSDLFKIRNFQTKKVSYQRTDSAVLGWHRRADHQNLGRRPRNNFNKNNLKSEALVRVFKFTTTMKKFKRELFSKVLRI